MANAEQIKALVKSHVDGDDKRFVAIATQVAASAAKQGHGRFADELMRLVKTEKQNPTHVSSGTSAPIPVVQPRKELAGLLSVQYSKLKLSDMVLEVSVLNHLNLILSEHAQADKIRSYGLEPRNRLLLTGPPGSGKTMTASALSGEMNLPLFTVVLDGLITKYMGETAAKLRIIFDAIQKTRGVYLFDEFDSIGSKRHSQNDVGEIRRVLNSLLQFLEQSQTSSIIVAATNNPQLLDPAVFRRFDDIIEYSFPSDSQREQLIKERLRMLDTVQVDWKDVVNLANELSFADIISACNDAAKKTILGDSAEITIDCLRQSFITRRASSLNNSCHTELLKTKNSIG
jgi:SpoVK/Ycf46/Vps4 family AAA+-type ATPase